MPEFSLYFSITLGVARVLKINYPQKEKVKMKKMSICIIMLGMFLSVSFGQEQTKFGLGFEFHTFPSAIMQDGGSLGIYVPIETGSLFIEPLIAYSSSSTETDYGDYDSQDYEVSSSNFTLLLGIFKPTEIGKIRSYYGIRFGKIWSKSENELYDTEEESDIIIIAPTVGAEYFVSDNFSFGGEGMYTMITNEEEGDGYTITNKVC